MINNVDYNVVHRNTIESDLGVSTLIFIKRLKRIGALYILPHTPSVRTLALLQLESSEGEPYTSENTLCPTIPYVSSKGLCINTQLSSCLVIYHDCWESDY